MTRATKSAPPLTESEVVPPLGIAPAEPPPAADELRLLPLDRIVPSQLNPRKTFDPEKLDQLAKSIREKGVLEPVIVRPRTLWQQVVGFVARQWARKSGEECGFGVSRSQMEAAGLVFADSSRFQDVIDALLDQARIESPAGRIGMWHPTPGALQPAGKPPFDAPVLHYQIVAGERRFRAAKLAGLAVIPAIVRDLDDRAAAEIAVVENDQREDVPPLEQAEGYAELVRLGDDAETIAAKIGRPAAYVVGRLQLTHLVPELADDMRDGRLPFGHALLLSKLQPADQTELRPALYQGYGYDEGRVISVGELRRRIHDKRLFCLSAAPWKWDDESLVPAAGSCTKCPKRSGNNRTLFDDLVEDDGDGPLDLGKRPKKPPELCTDGKCFQAKRVAFVQLQLAKSAEKNGGEPVKVSTSWNPADKTALGCDSYEVVEPKQAKLAKPGELKTAVIIESRYGEDDQVGKLVQVRIKREPKESAGSAKAERDRAEAERKKKGAANAAAAGRANALAAEKAQQVYSGIKTTPSAMLPVLRQLALALIDAHFHAVETVVKRRGLAPPKGKGDRVGQRRDGITLLENFVENCDAPAELFGLLAEITAALKSDDWKHSYYDAADSKEDAAFWRAFGVDRKKLVAEARAQQKETDKPAANGKPAKKAKGKRKVVARGS